MVATFKSVSAPTAWANLNLESQAFGTLPAYDWHDRRPRAIERGLLDKNGKYKRIEYSFTVGGTATTGTSSLWSNAGIGTWTAPMKKKFTPKPKRRGFRD